MSDIVAKQEFRIIKNTIFEKNNSPLFIIQMSGEVKYGINVIKPKVDW